MLRPEQLLKVEEVADILRVSRAQVYILKDRIGWVAVGRHVRFEAEAVNAYIARQGRCRAPAPVASLGRPPGHAPAGPTIKVASTVSPKVAAIMERQQRGLKRIS